MRTDSPPKLPLLILGGRDRRSTELPTAGRDHHLLRGYKAVAVQVEGRPLIEVVIERLRATGAFDPIYLAGPAALYGSLEGQVRLVDTDGGFGQNLEAGLETLRREAPPGPIALTTADILPQPEDLQRVLDDYRRHAPLDFFFPQCRVPKDTRRLGQSAWKPKYRVRPEGEDEPVATLPGHLLIVDAEAVRRELAYGIFDLAYRTRNRSVAYRLWRILGGTLWALVRTDLARLVSGRRPVVLAVMVRHGFALARELRRGAARQERIETHLRHMFLDEDHRARFPHRRGRVPVLDTLSLARDIDTVEEARELADGIVEPPKGTQTS